MLDRSIMGLLLRTDLLANDRSAVTRVIEILKSPKHTGPKIFSETSVGHVCRTAVSASPLSLTHLPSNLCLRKSKRAFCIMSVTWQVKKTNKKNIKDDKITSVQESRWWQYFSPHNPSVMVQPGPPASWREPRHREGRAPAGGTGKTMKKKEIKRNRVWTWFPQKNSS